MKNGAQLGGANAYNYDEEYCKKAAQAFGELLTLVEEDRLNMRLLSLSIRMFITMRRQVTLRLAIPIFLYPSPRLVDARFS